MDGKFPGLDLAPALLAALKSICHQTHSAPDRDTAFRCCRRCRRCLHVVYPLHGAAFHLFDKYFFTIMDFKKATELFSDPDFLAEMEREFGPDYEALLREHMQAEALRNTSNYSAYTGHDRRPDEGIPQQSNSLGAQQCTPTSPAQSSKPMEGTYNRKLEENKIILMTPRSRVRTTGCLPPCTTTKYWARKHITMQGQSVKEEASTMAQLRYIADEVV